MESEYSDKKYVVGEKYSRFIHQDLFEKLHFVNCSFENIVLPDLKNCVFSECFFLKCKMKPGRRRYVDVYSEVPIPFSEVSFGMDDVRFVDCQHIDIEISSKKIRNIYILNGSIKKLIFSEVFFSSLFCINSTDDISEVKITKNCSYDFDFREILDIENGKKILTWSNINFLSNAPIPKVGFSIFLLILFIIPFLNYLISFINNLLQNDALIFRSIAGTNQYVFSNIEASNLILVSFFLLIFLIITSLSHKAWEPKEINQFSEMQWLYERRRSLIEYRTADRSSPFKIKIIMISYIFSLFGLFVVYCKALGPYIFN